MLGSSTILWPVPDVLHEQPGTVELYLQTQWTGLTLDTPQPGYSVNEDTHLPYLEGLGWLHIPVI